MKWVTQAKDRGLDVVLLIIVLLTIHAGSLFAILRELRHQSEASQRHAAALEGIYSVQSGSRKDHAWNSDALSLGGRESVTTPYRRGEPYGEWVQEHRDAVALWLNEAEPK